MGEETHRADRAFHGETEIIETVFAPLAAETHGAFGLVDDAALFTPCPGEEVVLTTDMIVAGVHFLEDAQAGDVVYKALAVNVSDLVAKGADPDVYLLSIALAGTPDRAWLEALQSGLAAAQGDFGCVLAGGDTVHTPGPLCLSVTALGRLPEGEMVHRFGARPGDAVYVTGTVGDGAAGLKLMRQGSDILGPGDTAFLTGRYRRPKPEPALAAPLRAHASAAMDISDGLAGDFAKLCAASGCGGRIEAESVPLSPPATALLEAEFISREELLCGGDDYCVLAAVPPEQGPSFEQAVSGAGGQATRVGQMEEGREALVLGKDGRPMRMSRPGYDHFRDDPAG
jgi:thiamine-monophosphate kinase